MLITLIIWIYSITIAYIYGWFIWFLVKAKPIKNNELRDYPLIILMGMCALTTIASIFSLFMPIGFLAHLLVFVIAVLILVWGIITNKFTLPKFKTLNFNLTIILTIFVFTVIFLNVLENATHLSSNPDSGIYHAQAIRWIETFPVVPGLGNLHTRFAYNSAWLVLNALFSFSFLGGQSYHLTGSLIYLITLSYFFCGVIDIIKINLSYSSIIKVLLIPVSFITLASDISSPGTDLPATLLTWVIICEWVQLVEERKNLLSARYIIIVILSIFCITIKLSTLPMLLIPIIVIISSIKNRNMRCITLVITSSLFIFIPWIFRNTIISGYIIYPQTLIDIFNFDWKIPLEFVKDEQISIITWARNSGLPSSEAIKLPTITWINIWFSKLTTNRKLILLSTIAMPIVVGFFVSIFPQKTKSIKNIIHKQTLVYILCFWGIIYWFITAPDYRFGYGFLIITSFSSIALIIKFFYEHMIKYKKYINQLLLIILFLSQSFILFRSFESETISERFIAPLEYPSLPTSPCEGYNFTIFCADFYAECWYDPFPCIPYTNPAVGLRKSSFMDGFRVIE